MNDLNMKENVRELNCDLLSKNHSVADYSMYQLVKNLRNKLTKIHNINIILNLNH